MRSRTVLRSSFADRRSRRDGLDASGSRPRALRNLAKRSNARSQAIGSGYSLRPRHQRDRRHSAHQPGTRAAGGFRAGAYSRRCIRIFEPGVRHVERRARQARCPRRSSVPQAAESGSRAGRATCTSAISTIVVNNNAAAVLLALNTLAEGGEVIVSRGELVEIGGSFRIPDVMSKSQRHLARSRHHQSHPHRRLRTRDQRKDPAVAARASLQFRDHRIHRAARPRDLADLARKRNIPLMEDLGSGAFFDLRSIGVNGEPGVLDSLRAGVDVVSYSGDKLLGGPQAGMLSGRSDLIARMRANSLFRALRVDKLTYAALEATLLAYVKHDHDAIPALRMMHLSKDEIGQRAEAVAETSSLATVGG